MPSRGLLIAALVMAALGGGVYWSNKIEKAKEGQPSPDAPPVILKVPEDQIQQIEIRKEGAEPTVVQKSESGDWQITQPKTLRADKDSVGSLTSSLSNFSSDRLVEEKAANLAPYGLDNPDLKVAVRQKDKKEHLLLIGDETPTGGGYFAKLEGDPRVFTVYSSNKTGLDKSYQDLRDKRLLTFDQDKLTRVELSAKGQNLEFGKNAQNEWQILKPKPLRAESFQVEELVRKLKDAKMDTAVSEEDGKKAASAFQAGKLVAVAKLTDNAATQTLEIRQNKEDYYAKSSVVDGAFKVTSDLGQGVDKGLEDFRNKKLFDFGWNDPTKVEIKDGGAVAVYEKSGEKWMSGGKVMDSTSVRNVIDKLRDLSATKFVEQGFTNPTLEATVTSNEGKRVEKVLISKNGDKYFARRDNEPSIYELDAKMVEDLQSAAKDVKPEQPPKEEKKK